MAELADEWPSLAPIRTSCISSSSSYYYYEPNTHISLNSSCSPPLSLPQKPDYYHYSFQSPPSSSSSHVSFLHSSTTINHKKYSFLSKCFPPRPNSTSHGFPKQCINASPGKDMRRAHAGAGIFRSAASFPGQGCRPGSTICGTAANVTHSGPLKQRHSCPLKSHVANMNAFTMIPANVVGKKKGSDYLSDDEPTSPEVTCIGRVRRSKHSKSTWDALLNSSEKFCRKTKAPRKQIESSARNDLDHDMQLDYIPRPLSMGSSGAIPKWRKMFSLFKDIKGLHFPYVQRKLREEDLVIDLSRLRAAWGTAADRGFDNPIDEREMHDTGNGILYICQAGEGEEDSNILEEEDGNDLKHVDAPLTTNPTCLLLMHNMSSRSKVFYNHGDNGGDGDEDPDPHALKPPADQMKKQAASFWKNKKLIFSSSRTIVRR